MKGFILYITLIGSICTLHAQNGSLKGQILDDSNEVFENVFIQLKETKYTAISNSNGYFKIKEIKPGNYTLLCTGTGNSSSIPVSICADKDTFILIHLHHSTKETEEIVVTATRTEKDIADVAIPIKTISATQISQMGSLRLNEVLQEQTGLAMVADQSAGTGLQMQGFNPDYTMFLLNGEPMIGRTAGTFDLTRISVGNIKKIEIIKGPSSSLYGSEALAGVVNIITEKPKDGLRAQLKPRYSIGTRGYQVTDLTGDVSYKKNKIGLYLFGNHYQSQGYDLTPETKEKTVPPFFNYTIQTRMNYTFSTKTELILNARYFNEISKGFTTFTDDKNVVYNVDQKGTQYDWNLNPVLNIRYNARLKHSIRYYATQYYSTSLMTNVSDGSLYDKSFFNQTFNRPETQLDYRWNENQQTTLGIGTTFESVNSTRYTNGKYFYNIYGYAQHDFTVLKRLNIVAGARMDNHSVYGRRISPKISTLLKATKWLSLKASAGEGFKAPDFRQLYLNFSNPVVGYNVFGSEEVKQQFATLQQQGQISQVLMDVNTLQPIKAEYSIAYNAGFVATPHKAIQWNVNFFYNNIKDLIETGAIAIKTNGQSVYTYFNQSRVFTAGVETDATFKLVKNLSFSIGYQYLEAKNKQVLEDIAAGKYFSRDPVTLETVRLTKADYGGLFNRSKNMGNIRLFYLNPKNGLGASLRCIYRGKYGYGDTNGNNILDDKSEYVNGYYLWNLSFSKKLYKKLNLQVGIDNLFDYTNPTYVPSIPGRIYYASVALELNKKNNK